MKDLKDPLRYAAIEIVAVRTLRTYDGNARTHDEAQVAMLAANIAEFGFTNPLLVDERDVLIAGHGRLLAAQRAGMTEVPCIRIPGLTPARRAALVLADNAIALKSGWDTRVLAEQMQVVEAGIRDGEFDFEITDVGFTDLELKEFAEVLAPPAEPEPEREIVVSDEPAVCRAGNEWMPETAHMVSENVACALPIQEAVTKTEMLAAGEWIPKVKDAKPGTPRSYYLSALYSPEGWEKRDLVGFKAGGGIKVRKSKDPIAGVQVNISMPWQQADDGFVDLTTQLREAFPDGNVGDATASGPSALKRVPAGVISTLTPEALVSAMPKQGSGLGGASGYEILQATLKRIPTPIGGADRTGAVRGQKARYDYVKDPDLKKPIGLGFDVAYFSGSLVLQYSLRQRREEHVRFFVTNRNVAYADGAVETITMRCEDPTLDENTQPWQPGQNVAFGDERRVGNRVWSCLREHVTAASFTRDLELPDGTDLWQLLGTTGAPAGTSNLLTWFGTPAGERMVAAAAHQALKKIALEQRCIEIRFTVPLMDWPEVSTAWAAQIEVDAPLVPGGIAFGKVTSVDISQSGTKDYAKADVTIVCCNGGGEPGPDQISGINPSGELWDGIYLQSPLGAPSVPCRVLRSWRRTIRACRSSTSRSVTTPASPAGMTGRSTIPSTSSGR